MNIEKLEITAARAASKFFRLAASAKTQAQINAATLAESVACRAAMKLDAFRS